MKKLSYFILFCLANCCFANGLFSGNFIPHNSNSILFLWIALFIFLSRSLSVVKKFGLPLVIGEIIAGVIIGDLHFFGITLFDGVEDNAIIMFLAGIGSIILMFEIGIESKLTDLRRNFRNGTKIAVLGTLLTFVSGYLIGAYFVPKSSLATCLLLGVITASTATGISAKTFKELKIMNSKEVKLVLVASIIDEFISVVCFAVISGLIINASFSFFNFSITVAQVLMFFAFAVIFGSWITPVFTKWSTRINPGLNMKIGVLFIICLLFSWVADVMGLATVIGAFVAGLMLDEFYFKSFSKSGFFRELRNIATNCSDETTQFRLNLVIETQEKKSLEELLKPLSHLFVPIFFIHIGLMLDVSKLTNLKTLVIVGLLLGFSFIGRILSGCLIKGNLNKLIIGLGMTPIGEAGLIFATFGKSMNLIGNTLFTAIVSSVVLASITTPILIKLAIKYKGINHE